MAKEKCLNCGCTIGDLETPYHWNERIVCHSCCDKLNPRGAAPKGVMLIAGTVVVLGILIGGSFWLLRPKQFVPPVVPQALAATSAQPLAGTAKPAGYDSTYSQIKKIEAKVEAGVIYADYSRLVGDTYAEVKPWLEGSDAATKPSLSAALKDAMGYYIQAGDAWNQSLNPNVQCFWTENSQGWNHVRLLVVEEWDTKRVGEWEAASEALKRADAISKADSGGEMAAKQAEEKCLGETREQLIKIDSELKDDQKLQSAAQMSIAASASKFDEVMAMIKSGADVNAKMASGDTALMGAADANPKTDIIEALLKAGANVNAKNNGGWTPLMYASLHNTNVDVITVLLKAGADVNAKDNEGKTPLMQAVMLNQNPDVIEVLITGGADVNAKDKDGKTALDIAHDGYNSAAAAILAKAGGQGK